MANRMIGIPPFQYVHILDLNTNICRLESGPGRIVLETNERLQDGPLSFIIVPPGHYCTIKNPIAKYVRGEPVKLYFGHSEVRFHQEPFPLYPGEQLEGLITALPVVKANHAIQLRALYDFEDELGLKRNSGDVWQINGPCTYKPRSEVMILKIVKPIVLKYGEVARLRAKEDFTDSQNKKRFTGEEWFINKPGAYLTHAKEKLVGIESALALTKSNALLLRADVTLTDQFGKDRQTGDEWLITSDHTDTYYPEIGVEVVSHIEKIVLFKNDYCVVLNPQDANGVTKLGQKELRKGVSSFFLNPGEELEGGIKQALILECEDSVLLKAIDDFKDDSMKEQPIRRCGEQWMITGPFDFVPPIQVEVIARRNAIALAKNEGIYVRNLQTGHIRVEMGEKSYMLTAFEELYEKDMPDLVVKLLKYGGGFTESADIRKAAYYEQSIDSSKNMEGERYKTVTYRCPHNSAVQVYNYKQKTSRVIFGPNLVVLGPHENFNVLSLSAGKPKKPNVLKSLCLMLGPDFITDHIEVETSDHARLSVKMAFNNHFEYDVNDETSSLKIFAIPDFIGFACRQVGSRIRAAVAMTTFDSFHRHSAQIISHAVFGMDDNQKLNSHLKFDANNLVITNIDIQSIEPVDMRMRDSLQKSVQMAIEISTKSIENAAAHEAKRTEQIARGKLELQKIFNEKEAEKERAKLNGLQAEAAAVESTGQAKAEALARAERMLIECQSEIQQAKLKAKAADIEEGAQLETRTSGQSAELLFLKVVNEMEIHKKRTYARVEKDKLMDIVNTIGKDTLAAIATAGPDMKVKLLQGLGLKSVLFTNGNSPINLFETAEGFVQNRST